MASTVGTIEAKLRVNTKGFRTSLKGAEKSLESFGTRMFFLGSRITAGITLPIIAVTAAIVKMGAGFDQAMTESLAIISNVSQRMRAEMEETAKVIATTTKFSSEEAAQAYFFLASSGMNAAQAMKALPVAANFAQAGVIGLEKATELLSDAYITLGLRSDDATENMKNMETVSDILTEANNRAQGTIEEFALALTNRAGVAFRIFGVSVQEGVAALAAFAERGIKGRTAGRQMFIVMRDLQKSASENKEAWDKLVGPGAVYDEASGQFNKLADILEVLEGALDGLTDREKKATLAMLGFQERSLQATLALVGAHDRIRELEAAFLRAGGVTKRVAEKQMASFTNQMHILQEKVKIVAIELFDSLQPAINDMLIPALKNAIKFLQDAGRWFKNLDTSTKSAIMAWVGFVAALGPALVALGSLSLLISGLSFAFSPLTRLISFVVTSITALTASAGVATLSLAGLKIALTTLAPWLTLGATLATGLYIAFKETKRRFEDGTTAVEEFAAASGHTADELTDLKTKFFLARKELMETNRWTDEGKAATEIYKGALEDLAYALGISTDELDLQGRGLKENYDRINDVIRGTKEMQQGALDLAAVQVSAAKKALEEESAIFDERKKKIDEWVEQQSNVVARPAIPGMMTDSVHGIMGGRPAVVPMTREEISAEWFRRTSEAEKELTEAKREHNRALEAQIELVTRLNSSQEELYGTRKDNEELGPTPEEIEAAQERIRKLGDEYKKFRERIKDLRVEILGLESDEFKELRIAVDENIDSIIGNDKALENLWGVYKKFRDGLAVTNPLLDRLTSKFRRQEEALDFGKTAAGKFVMAMTNIERKYEDILTKQDRVTTAFIEMNGQMSPRFFEEYGDELKILALHYGDRLEPALRSMVDLYFETEIAAGKASAEMRRSQQEATQSMIAGADKLNAELIDLRSELTLFSLAADDKELVGMKKGLAKKKLAYEKTIVEMAKGLTFLTGAEYMAGVERIRIAKETMEEILRVEEDIGLLRLADALGVNDKILRSMEGMTRAQKLALIEAYQDVQKILDRSAEIQDVSSSVAGLFEAFGFDEAAEAMGAISGHTTDFVNAWAKFETGDIAEQIAGILSMVSSIVAVGQQMSQIESRKGRAGAGAMAGAQIGGTFGGAAGAAAGAGIGAIVGAVMDDPGWAQMQTTIHHLWRVSVTDELAKAVEETAQEIGSDWGAMLLHLNDIIAEGGGVTKANVDSIVARIRDSFSMIDMSILSTAQASEILNENFAEVARVGTGMSGVINANVLELMKLNDQFKTGSEAIAEFKSLMVGEAVAGLNQFSDGVNTVMIGMRGGLETALAEAKEAFDKQKEENEDFEGDWDETAQKMRDDFRTHFTEEMLTDFDDLQSFTAMTFLAMVADGATFAEALNAVGPTLDVLKQGLHDMGIEGNESIERLLRIREFQQENEGIIKQVDGMNQLMKGLANSGLMTQSSFDQFGNTAQNQFRKMTDAGLGQNDALLLMAPTLQTLSDMADTYGFEVDENTQLLIDQAKEQGLLGDTAKTADDLMIEGLERIAKGIETLISLMNGDWQKAMEDAARKAEEEANNTRDSYRDSAGDIQSDFDHLTLPELVGHASYDIKYDWPEFSPPTGREGEHYAAGGIITRPHLAMVGEGGEPEMIGPVSFMSKALEGALGATGPNQIERETLNELHGLRSDLKTLPIHLRDAIILSG